MINNKNIKIILGDICYPKSEALILPANTKGVMNRGILKKIKKDAWDIVENEAKKITSSKKFNIGDIFVTSPAKLKRRGVKKIYHCILQNLPGDYISVDILGKILKNAFLMVKKDGYESVTLCNLGKDGNELHKISEARIILSECKKIELNIKIIDDDLEFIEILENLDKGKKK